MPPAMKQALAPSQNERQEPLDAALETALERGLAQSQAGLSRPLDQAIKDLKADMHAKYG